MAGVAQEEVGDVFCVFFYDVVGCKKKMKKNTHYKYDTLFNCKKMNI